MSGKPGNEIYQPGEMVVSCCAGPCPAAKAFRPLWKYCWFVGCYINAWDWMNQAAIWLEVFSKKYFEMSFGIKTGVQRMWAAEPYISSIKGITQVREYFCEVSSLACLLPQICPKYVPHFASNKLKFSSQFERFSQGQKAVWSASCGVNFKLMGFKILHRWDLQVAGVTKTRTFIRSWLLECISTHENLWWYTGYMV